MKKLFLALFLVPLLLSALKVDVSVNKNSLSSADQLELNLRISDTSRMNVSEPQPPQIPLFSFRNMTSSSSSSVSVQNFKSVSEYTHLYKYIYFPQKTGKTTIPSFKVRVNNRDYATRPIEVNVVPGLSKSPGQSSPAVPFRDPFDLGEPDFFSGRGTATGNTLLLALPEKQYVYRGFPAIVSYYLYTDEMVRSFNLEDEKDFSGYGKSTYEQPSMLNYETVTLNGKSYKRALVKRLALMPNTEGTLFAPLLQGEARLYNYGYLSKNLSSKGGEIVVRAIPRENVPADWNGAVGNFSLSHSISTRELSLGEALTVTLKITGKGNFNQFTAPQFSNKDGFQISSPMVSDNLQSGIEGTRTYYYTLIPQSKGQQILPELNFVWFGNEADDFKSYKLPPQTIKVNSAHVLSYLNSLWDPRTAPSMRPRIERSSYPPYRAVANQPVYWAVIILILCGLAIAAVIALDTRLKRQNPLAWAQKKQLHILRKYMKQSTEAAKELSPEFYPLAEKALFNYLNAKYRLPNHLSNQEKIAALREKDIPLDLIEDIQSFINLCQAARFMPENERVHNLSTDLARLKSIVDAFSRLRKNTDSSRLGGTEI